LLKIITSTMKCPLPLFDSEETYRVTRAWYGEPSRVPLKSLVELFMSEFLFVSFSFV
jgi:hypothetical protein